MRAPAALALAGLVGLTACASSAPAERSNAADAAFLQDMISHHTQAIAAGALAARQGSDPRVTAFGRRIVAEQTPELERMQAMVTTLGLRLSPAAGAAMAIDRVTTAQLTELARSGTAFDHDVIAASARSEQGAVTMARAELAQGRYSPALAVARSIAGAPVSEIPQLQALAAALEARG